MIHDQELVSEIRRRFGLNLYETKVWLALLSKGSATAGELADISNVPRSRTYDVLESLEAKKFISQKPGKPIKYVVVPPKDIITAVKDYTETERMKHLEEIERIEKSNVLGKLRNLYSQGSEFIAPPEESGAVRGQTNMRDHLDLMIRDAKTSIIILTTSDGITYLAQEHFEALKKASKNGASIKMAAHLNETNVGDAKLLLDIGVLRHSEDIHARIYVIDNDEVMFMVVPENAVHPSYDTGIWLRSSFFAQALTDLFEHAYEFWEHGEKAIKKLEDKLKASEKAASRKNAVGSPI